jgi:hypothetical protein
MNIDSYIADAMHVLMSIFEREVRQERKFLAQKQKSAKQISISTYAHDFVKSQFANDLD